MSGERIDYTIERQHHEGFIDRAAFLARLDQRLVADRTDRWVVVTGGPGTGKTTMLAAWLAQSEAACAVACRTREGVSADRVILPSLAPPGDWNAVAFG